MRQRVQWLIVIGWALAMPGMSANAEPEIVWPQEWTAFGPSTITRMYPYGIPVAADLLPGEMLKTIPGELVIGGERFQGQRLRLEKGYLDLGQRMPGTNHGDWARGKTVYLMAPVAAAADTSISIGAGADWWMQWWVDGRPVFDTLGAYGNSTSKPITPRDYVFEVPLTKGQHVLAVAVVGNHNGFSLALASPQELRAKPSQFQDVMEVGKRKQRPFRSNANFAASRNDFQRALNLAATDGERAEARLAGADSYFLDVQGLHATSAAAIRREYAEILTLPGARAEQKARAVLGIGETWLLENNGQRAREEFARARALSKQPRWTAMVQFATARAYLLEKNVDAARIELAQLSAQAGLDPTLQFDARLHLEALAAAPRIRSDHPRLFFNADTWPVVKARVEGDAEGFRRLQKEVEPLPARPEVKDWGGSLMSAALVYRVRGDATLLAKIRKMLRATVDHYLLLTDSNAHVETRLGWLAALDWVWADLPAAERDGLVRDMLRYAYGQHAQDMAQGPGRADADPYYYAANMHWYVGLAALEPGLDAVDYLRALAELGRGYDNNAVASFGRRIELMKDHGAVTRVEYALIDLPTPAWSFLHCWQSAVGPVPDQWTFASGFAPSYVLRIALGFTGRFHQGQPGFRHFGHGGSWRNKDGWITARLLYENLGQFIHFFSRSQPEEAAIAAYLRQRMEQLGCVGRGNHPITPYLLDLTASPAPKLPDGLPLASHYAGPGLVLMSSGFDPDQSTYALFSCGGAAFADHFDAGHFTIFKRGYLALDSGTRALAEGNRDGENYDNQTVAHNGVLIRMPGEAMPYRVLWSNPLKANTGGQRQLPTAAKVLAFQAQPLFAYAATDATETYHPDKCVRMVRQFLYLPPDHFVVFDRVVSKKAEYPKTWLLHTANEPAVTGKEFRADQEKGRLFCRTLLPADAVLEKIGGPGKEFWADGQNWPIPANSPALRTLGIKDASDVAENMGRWRVQVTPATLRTDDLFLHLIQVSDQSVVKMIQSRVCETQQQIELSFAVGPRVYAIGLKRTGEIGGHIRIEEAGKAVVDKDLTCEVRSEARWTSIR